VPRVPTHAADATQATAVAARRPVAMNICFTVNALL
jgi:hypothetical protein